MPYGRLFKQSLTGTIKCGKACPLNNYTFGSGGQLIPMTHGVPTTSSGLESGGDGGYASPVDTTMQPGSAPANSSAASAMTSPRTSTVYVQASWAESGDFSNWTPLAVSSAGTRPNTFFTNNPYLSAAAASRS